MSTTRLAGVAALIAAAVAASAAKPAPAPPPEAQPCRRCQWLPPKTARTVVVKTVNQLEDAVRDARSDTTILIEDGVYRLNTMLDIATPKVVLRAKNGDPMKVALRGDSMTEGRVGVAISISASDVTIADLTVGMVGFHAIQVRGEKGIARTMIHNVRAADAGQQIIKGSSGNNGVFSEDGTLACSIVGFNDTATGDYTDGIDVIGGRRWVVRDNIFVRVRGPKAGNYSAGPAILFWGGSRDTIVERNLILDSFRGIALGLVPVMNGQIGAKEQRPDHVGGIIRNNVLWNLNAWADEGIEANSAAGVQIDHNTVFVQGGLPWSISVRFSLTDALVRNNLMSKRVIFRDGGRATVDGNVENADADWFVDAAKGDLHLAHMSPAVEHGVPLSDVALDFDKRPRPTGGRPDAGAFEFGGVR